MRYYEFMRENKIEEVFLDNMYSDGNINSIWNDDTDTLIGVEK